MEIVFLGTSASLPTQLRWPSATALIRGGEILLFDCGEGTQIQFQKVRLKPGKLTKIFITHYHGDHFYGLIGLLTTLQLGGREKEISLYGPKGLRRYLTYMQEISCFTFRYDIQIHEVDLDAERTVWDFGNYQIIAQPLDHTIFVLGYRLQEKQKPGKLNVKKAERLGLPEGPLRGLIKKGQSVHLSSGKEIFPSQVLGPESPGKVVAICMDTRPCNNSTALAKDADVLVHDGTFDESKKDWAQQTGHSTVSQAAAIAQKAGVKNLVLTHISARYEEKDFNQLLAQAKKVFPNSILGYDLLRMQV